MVGCSSSIRMGPSLRTRVNLGWLSCSATHQPQRTHANRLGVSEFAAFRVTSGQVLLVASDGLIEQWDSTHQRFEGVLGQYCVGTNQTAQESIQELMRRFDAFRDTTPISDDLTVVAVRVI